MATAIGTYVTSSRLKARAGISDSTDDTLLGSICDQINAYIEAKTRRVLAPITSATYLFDGKGKRWLDVIQHTAGFIGGLRTVSLLEVAAHTGADYETVPSGDYFLRDPVGPAMPYDRLWLSDVPTGAYSTFPDGFATVRVTGTGGPAAIPDDVAELAEVAAVRAWHGRQAGQSDIVGTDEFGNQLVSRFFSARDLETLRRYTRGRDLI